MEKIFLAVVVAKDRFRHRAKEQLEELKELTASCGGNVVESAICYLERPAPNYYLREGKLHEIRDKVEQLKAQSVLFSVNLSPTQTRNLELFFKKKVLDRTRLILDIFARHARSKDGKLQVELAQLLYLLPRLSNLWEEFSRLGGGIGTRGPGEQKLETDRRRVRARIAKLKDELEHLRTHRALIRQARMRKHFPTAVIVGYTNAGKSTLLNTLSGSDVLVGDKLFATLDPTTRRVELADRRAVLVTDTVGFIENLPPDLVQAFRATLEEINETDLIIHVLDVANLHHEHHERIVRDVLSQLKVDIHKMILVLNKSDLLGSEEEHTRVRVHYPNGILISAKTGSGVRDLLEHIQNMLSSRT